MIRNKWVKVNKISLHHQRIVLLTCKKKKKKKSSPSVCRLFSCDNPVPKNEHTAENRTDVETKTFLKT